MLHSFVALHTPVHKNFTPRLLFEFRLSRGLDGSCVLVPTELLMKTYSSTNFGRLVLCCADDRAGEWRGLTAQLSLVFVLSCEKWLFRYGG